MRWLKTILLVVLIVSPPILSNLPFDPRQMKVIGLLPEPTYGSHGFWIWAYIWLAFGAGALYILQGIPYLLGRSNPLYKPSYPTEKEQELEALKYDLELWKVAARFLQMEFRHLLGTAYGSELAKHFRECMNYMALAATRLVRRSSPGVYCTIIEYDPVTDTSTVIGEAGRTPFRSKRYLPRKHYGIGGYVLVSGKPEVISRASQDPRFVPYENSSRLESMIVVPIFLTSEDEVEGLLSVCDPEPDMFTEEDLERVETVAQRVADAMAWKKYGRCYPVLER